MKTHWTASSIKDYIFRIAADLIVQLDNKMEALPLSQDALAKKIGVTKGAVSQMFNDPGNITLRRIVKYSKALNMKVAIVAYEDDDPDNKKGPINSEIFRICWEKSGKPREFWDFQEAGNEFAVENIQKTDEYVLPEYGTPANSFYLGDHLARKAQLSANREVPVAVDISG